MALAESWFPAHTPLVCCLWPSRNLGSHRAAPHVEAPIRGLPARASFGQAEATTHAGDFRIAAVAGRRPGWTTAIALSTVTQLLLVKGALAFHTQCLVALAFEQVLTA
jgi:hypothetical protein